MIQPCNRTRWARSVSVFGVGLVLLAAACGESNSAESSSGNNPDPVSNADEIQALTEDELETLGATRPLDFTRPAFWFSIVSVYPDIELGR